MSTATHKSKSRGCVRIEPGAKRVRTYLGGEVVADTTHPILVWEGPHYPTYYFPAADVHTDLLEPDGGVTHSPSRGDGRKFTVKAGDKQAAGAALRYEDSPIEELREQAEYWSVQVGDSVLEDLAWSYRTPLPESEKIAGLIAFYNEKVDLYVDGVRRESRRPGSVHGGAKQADDR
jgi:uncharacterized protein (DUF427 family)